MKHPKQANLCSIESYIFSECVSIMATFVHICIANSSFVSFVTILTNRLVLNLKQVGNSHMQTFTLPSLAFATNTFVGNLGAPFQVSSEGSEDEILQALGSDEYELQEQNREDQNALVVEDA